MKWEIRTSIKFHVKISDPSPYLSYIIQYVNVQTWIFMSKREVMYPWENVRVGGKRWGNRDQIISIPQEIIFVYPSVYC